jgi:hypothetical protein
MKKFSVVAALILGLFAAGCGSTKVSTVSSTQATAVATQAETQAQAVVNECAKSASFVTHAGRQKFLHCVAPAGHSKALTQCVIQVAEHSVGITGINEPKILTGAAKCVENNR